MITLSLILAVSVISPCAATPLNLGRALLVVTDFGADPTGLTDSDPGIQAAINSCSSSGCTVFFPAGRYSLNTIPSGASSFLTMPLGVPVTLAGAGQGSSVLEPNVAGNADVVQAAAGTTAFAVHDLGISFVAPPTGGAAIRVSSSSATSLYNVTMSGVYDAVALGQAGATTAQVSSTNIRGINATGVIRCFLNLSGGDLDTYVRGTYAQAPGSLGSQAACTGSTQGAGAFGITGLHVRDSRFVGFKRGFDFAANQTQLSDILLDNVSLDSTAGGPAFELYIPSGSSSVVQNVSVSNSTLQSASTACVLHGASSTIRLRNVTCKGGATTALPTGCTGSPSSRGYAVLAVSGTGGSGTQVVTITVTPTVGGPRSAMTSVGVGESASAVASALGAAINASTLVTTTGCPLLVPVVAYNDTGGSDFSIGSEIELYSYEYGPGLTPLISASAGSGPVSISVLNSATTFAAADGIFLGSPNSTSFPNAVSITSSHASMAQYGAGLHLQGASALLASANTFGDPTSPNAYGVWVDGSSGSYGATLLQDNNLSNETNAPVYFGGAAGSGFGPNVQFYSNAGYNPVGDQTTTVACTTPLSNPFPFPVEVYVSGPFSTIEKNGTPIYMGAVGVTSNDTVLLGVGESITIICTPGPTPVTAMFGQ